MGATYSLGRIGDRCSRPRFVAEAAPDSGTKPKLLAQRYEAIRVRHLSPGTEEAYRGSAGVRGPVDGLGGTQGGCL